MDEKKKERRNNKKERKGMLARRDFLRMSGAVGLGAVAGVTYRPRISGGTPVMGKKVESRKLTTQPASFEFEKIEESRVIRDGFKKLGFDLQIEVLGWEENVQKAIIKHDTDLWIVQFGGAAMRLDPEIFIYQAFHSTGSYNWYNYKNEKYDQLAEAQKSELDVNKRRDLVWKCQEMLYNEQPANVINHPARTHGCRTDNFSNWIEMVGEGIGGFWTDINLRPLKRTILREGFTTDVKTLSPLNVMAMEDFAVIRRIYDRLLEIGRDGLPKPWAAKEVEYINNKTLDITIREDMKFHDGTPVTGEDIKFSFDYQKKWKASFWAPVLESVDKTEMLEKYKVRLHLNKVNASFMVHPLSTMFIIPKHIWKDIPEKIGMDDPLKWQNPKPVGSGPFMFDYWRRGAECAVKKFKDHFCAPRIDGVIRVAFASMEAMAGAIEFDQCDRSWGKLPSNLALDLGKKKNVKVKAYRSHAWTNLSYNCQRPPTDDPVFRRALSYCIPRQMIKDVIYLGMAELGSTVIAPANEFWHNPNPPLYPENIEEGRRILKEAGYTWDDQGWLHYPANKS